MLLALLSFLGIMVGILLGALLRGLLPEHQLSADAKDAIRLGAGLIGTITALVLGLLIASAKNSYDVQYGQIRQLTANVILLDHTLATYGAEANETRTLVRLSVAEVVDRIWARAANTSGTAPFKASAAAEAAYARILEMAPRNEMQRSLQSRAIQIASDVAQARVLLFTQRNDAIPIPFLAVMVFWLAIIFGSFSLFSPPSSTVMVSLTVFAASASAAIYLILELSRPFSGLMRIASDPLLNALVPFVP